MAHIIRHKAALVVFFVFVPLINGCLQNVKSRNCPSFNHPAAKQWQPVEVGNTLVFTSADGSSAVYTLESITLNDPYVASVDVNDSGLDAPICMMQSTHVFGSDDNSHEIVLNLRQLDRDGVNPAIDSLSVEVIANSRITNTGKSERELSKVGGANLLNPQSVFNFQNTRSQFYDSRLLENGQSYSDIVELVGSEYPPNTEFLQYSLNGIMLSRDVGLIQLSMADGNVYTIVPE